jgi:hypothetical protein
MRQGNVYAYEDGAQTQLLQWNKERRQKQPCISALFDPYTVASCATSAAAAEAVAPVVTAAVTVTTSAQTEVALEAHSGPRGSTSYRVTPEL